MERERESLPTSLLQLHGGRAGEQVLEGEGGRCHGDEELVGQPQERRGNGAGRQLGAPPTSEVRVEAAQDKVQVHLGGDTHTQFIYTLYDPGISTCK